METEQVGMARVFKAAIIHHVFGGHNENIEVRPAMRGGPVVGYRPTGNMKVTIKSNKWGVAGKQIVRSFYIPPEVEKFRKKYDKLKDDINKAEKSCRLVYMYRYSGLIPKHIAKKHAKAANEKYPDVSFYESTKQHDFIFKKMVFYLRYYAKCPHCKNKFNGNETILGWTCNNCGSCLEDYDKFEWKIYP